MKFLHLGDLHFGKSLHERPLAETDQAAWVEQVLESVKKEGADAVVIAGDVYDRRVPQPEAMQLFDHFLTELVNLGKYVLVIPGNHDSAIRLSHVSSLLTSHKVFIAGETKKEILHVAIPDGDTEAVFWLMPYLFPRMVQEVLGREDITSYDMAARAMVEAQDIDRDKCNILVAHQNVLAGSTKPEHSESETIIGGVGEIDYTAFDVFNYVALGHIHNAQKIGREEVRYAGCPLYYDFSETKRKKALTYVTVNGKDIRIEEVEIPLLHRLKQVKGTLEEVLEAGRSMPDKSNYYIQCILTDKNLPAGAMDTLKAVYQESLVNVKREVQTVADGTANTSLTAQGSAKTIEDQLQEFCLSQMGQLPDGIQDEIFRKILEQQVSAGGLYLSDFRDVSSQDSREIAEFLLKAVSEEEEA